MAREIMTRLKFSNEEIRDVTAFVTLHMRLGEYRKEWTDATVKRLIRDCGAYLDDLFVLTRCDRFAIELPLEYEDLLSLLRECTDRLNASSNVLRITSPLNGTEIMEVLCVEPGPHLRDAKDFLTNEVIEGRLAEGDKAGARDTLRRWWDERNCAA